uniref:RING-type domain-containing protein n=1 Tax=Strongyloides venezuelensis TaxID=75913 RepID=A0A0K0FNW8_STRVS
MEVKCIICFESCAASGTNHAPYSTPCGHIMGKECLEKLKNYLNINCFNCPFCKTKITFTNCHPVYGIAQEAKDNVTKSRNKCEKLKVNFSFSKIFSENIDGTIKFFDEHNGNILIAGEIPSFCFSEQFLKIIDTKGKKMYEISKNKLVFECSCLCFNKSKYGVIEFCVGYINGTVELYRYKFAGNNFNILDKKKLTNFDFTQFLFGTRKINSVCFLPSDIIAISIGKGMICIWNKREECLSKTQIMIKCIDNESDFISQLTKTIFDDFIGIMNDKIYIFKKNSTFYELASETDKTIVSYSIDPKFFVLNVLYSNKSNLVQDHSTSQSFTRYKIIYDNGVQKYCAEKMINVQNIINEIPKSFISSLFAIENSNGPLMYHGIFANIRNNNIEIIYLNNSKKCVGYENFKDISNCLGVTFVGRKKFFFKSNSIRTIAIIFKNKVVVMDISYITTL